MNRNTAVVMASEEKSLLKQLGERHEKLKHKIHTTKIPIKSKWGRAAMGMLYSSITFGKCPLEKQVVVFWNRVRSSKTAV